MLRVLSSSLLLGIGATLTLDLWAVFLHHTFQVPPTNVHLVGRWILYMPDGIFSHSNIGSASPKHAECATGWIAHYLTGIAFALLFMTWAGSNWIKHPTLLPAIGFGVITVAAPFLVMQPAFGLGMAASKTSNPMQARLRSLTNHAVFGAGLYLFGWIAGLLW